MALAQRKSVQIHYELQDLNHYDLQASSWDLITSIFFQPQVNTRQRLYSQLYSALRPGGVFILECKCEITSDHNNRYPGADVLSHEIKPMSVIDALEDLRHLNEGPYHQGEQRTTQICAVRK
jgi:SAM-dependent methyltransferase